MTFELGIKSDPIEYRYSFRWLFSLMEELGVSLLQLGSFMELYGVDAGYLRDLREEATRHGVEIRSCFTAHRELGGFFSGDERLVTVAKQNYRRWIDVAAAVGAAYCGSNPGSVYRDALESKQEGINTYLSHMADLMRYAREQGLAALLLEPMSCSAEPPAFPEEIEEIMAALQAVHEEEPEHCVPVYLCSDTSHGIADRSGAVLHDALELFAGQAPYMAEFHFKNCDARFESTFGFGPGTEAGVIELEKVKSIIREQSARFPTDTLAGYLEISGPKLGREYSDHQLEAQLRDSVLAIQRVFGEILEPTSGSAS